nr:MAG TPA: hypothetical protein [Caudoviricetes sp.]
MSKHNCYCENIIYLFFYRPCSLDVVYIDQTVTFFLARASADNSLVPARFIVLLDTEIAGFSHYRNPFGGSWQPMSLLSYLHCTCVLFVPICQRTTNEWQGEGSNLIHL